MKLLKTTLAVVAATAISSAAFADVANVQYNWSISSAPAAITYNGQTILPGQTIQEEIAPGHQSVFKSIAGMKITSIVIPCALNNALFATGKTTANQVFLTNSSLTAKTTASDPTTTVVTSNCSGTAAGAVLDDTGAGTESTETVSLTTGFDEVSYEVEAITTYTGATNPPGTYSATVIITTTAG